MNVILKAIYFLAQRREINYQTHYRYIMIMYHVFATRKTGKKEKRRQNTKLNTTYSYYRIKKESTSKNPPNTNLAIFSNNSTSRTRKLQ